jgi:hypothetical protein
MATYQTFQQVGIKENISDIITNLTPTKTPFQSNIGTEKVHNVLFQWQEDSLRAVNTNAQVEGADPTYITATPTVMRNNVTQILNEAVVVSDTADTVTTYGRAKEMAYQMQKSASQVKRDLENALVGTAQTLVTGGTSTARQFAGMQVQIASGNITYNGGTISVPVALSEAKLLTNLQTCFNAGAEPTRIQVTPSNSVVVASFAAAAGRYRVIPGSSGGESGLVNVVNFYVSPFGEQKVEINRFLKAYNTLVYDPKQWAKAVLRPWTREALAKTGDATKQMIISEQSLKHKNYAASGLIVEGVSGFAPV